MGRDVAARCGAGEGIVVAASGLGIGIIGTGWGARVQVPIFKEAGLDVVALAGRDAAKTRRIADEYGVRDAYGDWRELVDNPAVQLVSIVTPPNEHLEMVTAALDAGKHVINEKPTAMDAREARAMLELAQARPNQMTLIDHELRFLPTMRRAKAIIRDELGEVRHVQINGVGRGRSDPNIAWTWWSDAAQGGGGLGASASHQCDTMRYLTGQEVVWVQAILSTFVKQRPYDGGKREVTSDDFHAVQVGLSGGGFGLLTGSSVAGANEPASFTVHCAGGAVRIQGNQLLVARHGGGYEEETRVDVKLPPGLPTNDFPQGTVFLAAALKRALEGQRDELLGIAATFEDGYRNQQVLDAARRSQAEGTRVSIQD